MSARCGHKNADHLTPGDWFTRITPDGDYDPQHIVTVEQFRCLDCGAWLPLGPANDEPAEVQVEIRAAELAAQWAPMDRTVTVHAERDGWAWHRDGHIPEWAVPDIGTYGTYDQRLAGYLARLIATHDTTHEHEEGELL